MALEPTEKESPEFSIDIGLMAEMSPAQERVLRAIASGEGFYDFRSYRAYLTEHGWTYYSKLRDLYGD